MSRWSAARSTALSTVLGVISSACSSSAGTGSPALDLEKAAAVAAAPTTYSAYSGTDYKPVPHAPALGPANYQFTDPTFGSRMLRVTDANTNAGESFISEYAGTFRTFNVDTTAIKLMGPHGDGYWLELDPNRFVVGDGSSHPVIHSVPFLDWQWSAANPDLIYGILNGTQLASFNKTTRAVTPLGGPPSGDAVAYGANPVGADAWVCAAVNVGGGQIQNTFTAFFCVSPSNPSNYRYVDVANRTINGVPQPISGWPNAGVGIHGLYGSSDPRHVYVDFHGGNWGGNGDSVFNLDTGTFSLMGNGDPFWSGHDSLGNGRFANGGGSTDGRDSRGLVVRDPDDLMDASKYLFVMQPEGPRNGWCDAEHSSWLNSLTNPNAPILDSRYLGDNSSCPFTWTGEIVLAATDGSNTVWRFAHNHNLDGAPGCFPAEAFAQISNDGRWALFSSPWGGKLGAGNDVGCGVRLDTFIVELK
jgi:hypothetical protein